MQEIEKRIAVRYDRRYGTLDANSLLAKLLEEAGELARALIRNDKQNAVEELGDCVIVLSSIARMLETTVPEATEKKIAVHEKRLEEWEQRQEKKKKYAADQAAKTRS